MNAGDRISDYVVERVLGEGGMGTVYLARHTVLDQQVAIKILDPEVARKPGVKERFIQEANIQAKLRHSNIVQVLTATKTEGDTPALIMEYVDGRSLSEVLEVRGALPEDDALAIMRQVLSAVAHAHKQGVIHRDLKPSNVMVMASGEAKVTDFGIAKVLGSAKLTRTGTAMGSAHYMSPEQIRRPETVDARSDIYSLGCVFYEVLAGRPPFGEKDTSGTESDFEIKNAHVSEVAPVLMQVKNDIPEWLSLLVMRMLEKEPEKRFRSCEVILSEISQPQRKRRRSKSRQQDTKNTDDVDKYETKPDSIILSTSDQPISKESAQLSDRKTTSAHNAAGSLRNSRIVEPPTSQRQGATATRPHHKKWMVITSLLLGTLLIFFLVGFFFLPDSEEYFWLPLLSQKNVAEPSIEERTETITKKAHLLTLAIERGNPNDTISCEKKSTKCWGTRTYSADMEYIGELDGEKRDGVGTIIWTGGSKYVGEFNDDKKTGLGIYIWPDGERYIGEFKDNKKDGLGTFINSDGRRYVGEWKNDDLNGRGTFLLSDGEKYFGKWRNGKNGQGTHFFPDGRKEIGEFKEGRLHGLGIKYNTNGGIEESGIYENNQLVKSEPVDPNSFSRTTK
jgi:serine/threonine protein kinase